MAFPIPSSRIVSSSGGLQVLPPPLEHAEQDRKQGGADHAADHAAPAPARNSLPRSKAKTNALT